MNLELFPCSGGMAEGVRRAGITFDFAFDFSADACESYAGGEDTAPGTAAEVLLALHVGSLHAPLESNHHALYERLFSVVFPSFAIEGDHTPRERWDGAAADLLRGLKRRVGARRFA